MTDVLTDQCWPAPPSPERSRYSFGVLVKPVGAICNLDCEYCYYLRKRDLYPDGHPRMSEELMALYIRQLLEAQPDTDIEIAWHGGEPTVRGLPFYRAMVAAVDRYRRPGQHITHVLQTNGTLLDDQWGEFLAANGALVGISVDGPPRLHDAYRHDRRGRPTAERVLAGLDVLRRHGVEHNILCTVNAANASEPLTVYRYFRDELKERYLQFIPVVEQTVTADGISTDGPIDDVARVSTRSVSAEQWGAFLCAIFDEWLRRDVGSVFVQQFDAALAAWVGASPGSCVFAETCGMALALEHNGDLYSCDHFVDPEHRLGNIRETHLLDLVSSQQQQRFGLAKRDSLPSDCRGCEFKFACWGECPRNRFLTTAAGEPGLNYLCAGYKRYFGHVAGPMRLMAELLRAGRAPSEVIELFARAPRNGPCPCGSGRKAKHCHCR
jgi:uncharacterized protein